MLASILFTLLAAIVIGAILLALGIRGKRLNDHPTCRDCGFDLENVYPASSTCPECGSGLKRPKAVRTGQRGRRPVFIGVGLLLILGPLAPIGVVAFAAITGQEINRYKPLGLLIWEAKHADAKTGKVIAAELMTRLLSAKLEASQEDRIVEFVLARQENIDIAWDDAWGDLLDRAKLDGRLSTEQQQRYLNNAVVPKLKTRARVAVGDPIPVSIETELRGSSTFSAYTSLWGTTSTLNGTPLTHSSEPPPETPFVRYSRSDDSPLMQKFVSGSKGQPGWGALEDPSGVMIFTPASHAAPGVAELKIEAVVQTVQWDPYNNRNLASQRPKADDPKARCWVLTVPVTIATKEAGGIERVPANDELASKLANQLRPSRAILEPGGFFSSRMLNMTFSLADLPVPVCFDVFWRSPDKTEKLGTICSGVGLSDQTNYYNYPSYASSGGKTDNRAIFGNASKFKGYRLDLVLKPRPDLAARTIDLTRVYDGEIVIRDIVLTDSNGSPFKKPAKDNTAEEKKPSEEAKTEEPKKEPAPDPKPDEPAPQPADPKS